MYAKDDKNPTPAGTPAPADKGTSNTGNQFNSNRAFAGVIVLTVGTILLANRAGAEIPGWITSIGMLLIAIGVFIGFRQKFRHWVWLIPVAFGLLFLANDLIDGFSIHRFIWPLIIITVGLVLIFKPKKAAGSYFKDWGHTYEESSEFEFVDSTAIFGAVKKNIISKNFRGGDVTSIFGGIELHLGQADINGRADLDLTHIFGGAKLVVPADWTIRTDEVVCIFGGLDDKRKHLPATSDPNKLLVLHGTCIFGGIDIKSY